VPLFHKNVSLNIFETFSFFILSVFGYMQQQGPLFLSLGLKIEILRRDRRGARQATRHVGNERINQQLVAY
jgi:hypothetical protein